MYSEANKRANQTYYEKNKEKIAKKWKKITVSTEVHEVINKRAKELKLSVNDYILELLKKN